MKEFTVTNIFKCWLKLWPVTVILLILGAVGGVMMANRAASEYTARMDLLIVDERDGSSAVEYAGLANSDLVSDPAFEKAAVDDECTITASGSGDVIAFNATCPTEDEAKHLAKTAAENFTEWAQDIYGKENFRTVTLMNDEAKITQRPSGMRQKVLKIVVVMGAMLVVSIVIAFIQLDYKVSKHNGKKA